MNTQRMIIYDMRRDVLEDRDVTEQLHGMFENIVGRLIDEFAPEDVLPDEWDLDGLSTGFRSVFGFEPRVEAGDEAEPKPMFDDLVDQVRSEYERREKLLEEEIRESFRKEIGGDESQVDFARLARKRTHDLEMMALLRAVDEKWIDHLYSMDYLRDSVRLRAYGQKDPLVEYKSEAFDMFQSMMATIEEEVTQTLFRLSDPEVRRRRRAKAERGVLTAGEDPFAQLSQYSYVAADKQQDRSFASFDTSRFALAGQPDAEQQQRAGGAEGRPRKRVKQQPIRKTGPDIKPNDPCPCGSGKKYKKCCGAIAKT
jgi:preprotein translocase subunit SecA